MPSEESAKEADPPRPPPDLEPAKEQKSKVPEAESNSDDPTKVIKSILTIVDELHTKFGGEKILVKSRSAGANSGKAGTREVDKSYSLRKEDESERYIPKLRRNLRLLQEDVVKLQDLRSEVGDEVHKHITPLDKLCKKLEKDSSKLTKGMKKDLEDINKKIFNLMCQVPLLPNKRTKGRGSDSQDGYVENNGKGIVCLPGFHANKEDLIKRAVFKDVQKKFKELESWEWKICLLSLAVFPENQEVNRTMLMYWWIGEGILPDGAKPEVSVKAILKEFTDKKLIEPVENKRKVEPNSYKMTPFVHSALVLISKEIKLFDIYHEDEKKPTMNKSDLLKVCLVEGSSNQEEAKASKMEAKDIETVFNVSERFPDFTFKWFSVEQSSRNKAFARMGKVNYSALKVFYLGRWERTAKRHIEVENPELMKNLKNMIKLRLLSFQGVSRIERLDDAVCKLHELIILDLRACYNLEKLPDKIDSLKKLIYLDITDCYMLDRMPKRLSWLDNLEVLKGFVVSDATDDETVCLLAELVHLKKLRKLSIIINKGDFTVDFLFLAIKVFKKLEKLKVAWGGINKRLQDKGSNGTAAEETKKRAGWKLGRGMTKIVGDKVKVTEQPGIPSSLRKLDLQCLPGAVLPQWLEPGKLLYLEKLYIKGGIELTSFGKSLPEKPNNCTVKVLRLKFLPRLKVEWRELSETYFPKLEFLEKYQCPQVSLCPCDGTGIWRKAKSK